MAELLKLKYNELFAQQLSNEIQNVYQDFNINQFKNQIFNSEWEKLELKDRMHHITHQIESHLPFSYKEQINILNMVAPKFRGLTAMIFPNFVEHYGIEDFETSIKALEFYTQFSTSEFAIRPFIIQYPTKSFDTLLSWSTHENFHVRRLASEGCRPLLPWAMKLKDLVNNPKPIFPILENLKADHEDYVYRSVANNLNDISKHHPQLILDLCESWLSNPTDHTKWIIKHALRTLLKEGNQRAMQLFGFGNINGIKISNFAIEKTNVNLGDTTHFNLKLKNSGASAKFRLEYTVFYLKKNGKHNPKVFQLKETHLKHNESLTLRKKMVFTDFSTRKHYKGQHWLILKINGVEIKQINFNLI